MVEKKEVKSELWLSIIISCVAIIGTVVLIALGIFNDNAGDIWQGLLYAILGNAGIYTAARTVKKTKEL